MRLFRRGKKDAAQAGDRFEEAEEGMAWLLRTLREKAENEFKKFVHGHLERIHQPGGYEREKKEFSDFMDLGMGRAYLKALDEIRFSPGETIVLAAYGGRGRGACEVVTRWTVQGIHRRPVAGVEPTGEETTIEGVTISSIRDYRLRSDYSYWQIPELTRRFLGS